MKEGFAEVIARVRSLNNAAALRTAGSDGSSGITRPQLLGGAGATA